MLHFKLWIHTNPSSGATAEAGYPRDKDFAKTNLHHKLRRSSHQPLQTTTCSCRTRLLMQEKPNVGCHLVMGNPPSTTTLQNGEPRELKLNQPLNWALDLRNKQETRNELPEMQLFCSWDLHPPRINECLPSNTWIRTALEANTSGYGISATRA